MGRPGIWPSSRTVGLSGKPGSRRGGKLHPTQFIPLWGPKHTALVQMVCVDVLARWGVHDVRSYLAWRKVILLSVAVCACTGGYLYGIGGFIGGGMAGVVVPLFLVLVTILLCGVALMLLVYCVAWYLLLWVLQALFRW